MVLGCAWTVFWLACAGPAWALLPDVRSQEIATCLPGELATWGDGRDRPASPLPIQLAYRHAGAPAWFSPAQVQARVQQAAVAWAQCGVPVVLLPVAHDAPEGTPLPAGTVQVRWDDSGSAGHFGLAHVQARTLTLGRGAFALLRERNPAYPALDVLQMTISHEMGHFFGLMAHSRRCVDVMSYYTNAQGQRCSTRDGGDHRRVPEYRALLPTACDIARCKAVNGR